MNKVYLILLKRIRQTRYNCINLNQDINSVFNLSYPQK